MQNRFQKEGARGFQKGSLTNPYNVGTQRNREWELGFNKKYFENLTYVKAREDRQKELRDLSKVP